MSIVQLSINNNMALKILHFKYYRIFASLLIILLIGFSSCSGSKKNNKKKVKYKGIAKVFNDNKEALKYTLTIFVDQPGPGGDRDTYEFVDYNIDAGHTFVKLERENADGTKSTIIVGFYPDKLPRPSTPITNGYLGDDTVHPFEVKKVYTVTKENFDKSLKYIETIESSKIKYNLNDYNCTDFVIQTVTAAGEVVPDTYGTWASPNPIFGTWTGGGSNPGDLGEDLR